VLALPPRLAPWKCTVLPLDGRVVPTLAQGVFDGLRALGLSASLDASGASIGKRYARADELGTPFAVTVDFESAADHCATLRERDSTRQVRLPLQDVPAIVRALCEGSASWEEVEAKARVKN
jgi:glycyl-tRNA synthetase